MKNTYKYIAVLCIIAVNFSCESWLDEKPDKKLIVPSKLSELQGLLDFQARVNEFGSAIGELYGDNYYITDQTYQNERDDSQRKYRWASEYIFNGSVNDWSYEYDNVFRANTVIDNMDKIDHSKYSSGQINATLGNAYFLRAEAFLNIVSIWCKAYEAGVAATELGIPLRLTADINALSTRATLKDSYLQILTDLKKAASLLPDQQITPFRPTKAAAYGFLVRTYLWMNDYENVERYADSCLHAAPVNILDYKKIVGTKSYPFERFNPEVIYEKRMITPIVLVAPSGLVNKEFFNSYTDTDLRKALYYTVNSNGTANFRGSYEGVINLFMGLTYPEVIFSQAEAKSRLKKDKEARDILANLLKYRYSDNSFQIDEIVSSEELLSKILIERRKELAFRSLRFMDIKRLNVLGGNIVQEHMIKGEKLLLLPNSNAYALPIPEEVILLSGIQQNPK